MKDIYSLALHESLSVVLNPMGTHVVIRVPGGWIYMKDSSQPAGRLPVFVPFNNEFQPK